MPTEKRIFDSSKFVNRQEEIKWVFEILKAGKKGVLIFEGDKGSGKTTLLFELHRRISQESGFTPFLISLSPYTAPELAAEGCWIKERPFAVSDVMDVMQAVVRRLRVERVSENAGSDLQKDYFARNLTFRNPSYPAPVLLVDSIYECEETVRNEIEKFILVPLLASERAFIILSGRGRRPIWARPELQNAEVRALSNFSEEHVKELLKKTNSPYLEGYKEVYRLSGGYPLIARLMAEAERTSNKSFLGALSEAIDVMLKDSLRPEETRDEKRYMELREQIEKLSLVGIEFREADVHDYLYPGDKEKRAKTRKLIEVLLQANVLRYESKGYKLNDSISCPVRTFLREYKTSVYESYLAELRKISERMQDNYPNAKEWYRGMAAS